MNEPPENINNSGCTDLETLDYLRGVKSSTCLLLSTTPSPTPLDVKHPLSEEINEGPFLNMNDESNSAIIQTDVSAGDSSSSADSNSVVQDPVSAQLINNISMLDYQTLSKNGDIIIGQTEDCKVNGNLKINNRKLPNFVNWNWSVIRKILLWIVVSGLVACLGAIIAMVITIPKSCNPDLPWYQGKVFYEIFPANFKDSNRDNTGNFKDIFKKLDHIQDLGASAIRLNYMFHSKYFDDNYFNLKDLVDTDKKVGILKDFQDLIVEIHNRNMSLILDLPVQSLATPGASNFTHEVLVANDTSLSYNDPTSLEIAFWARAQNVDGFYLKNLENFVKDANFGKSLQFWKQIIGNGKIFIASEKVYEQAEGDSLNILLSRIDLIDINLDLQDSISDLKDRIDKIVTGPLWAKPHYPWVHWNIGNINSERISMKHTNNTLALTSLEFILPGTISIFYADEVDLGVLQNSHKNSTHTVPMTVSDQNSDANMKLNTLSDIEPIHNVLDVIRKLSEVRLNTPTIYLKAIYKEGNLLKNMEIDQIEENLVVIERWYPRRNTCVFVGNLGNKSITTDLSSKFYGGTVVAGTNVSLIGQVMYFDQVTFLPNSAIILKLEK